jgi:hypothetical protein
MEPPVPPIETKEQKHSSADQGSKVGLTSVSFTISPWINLTAPENTMTDRKAKLKNQRQLGKEVNRTYENAAPAYPVNVPMKWLPNSRTLQ